MAEESFSNEQIKAINSNSKHLLVTARAERLLKNNPKNSVIIFAFNNKAVDEINERIGFKIAETFHSFANRLYPVVADLNDKSLTDNMFKNMLINATRNIKNNDVNYLKHILIDEFQDFNQLFFDLINRIRVLNSAVNIFAVGDDWQSINSFAGANVNYFKKFEHFFPNPEKLFLRNNYRSKYEIVRFANSIMENYYDNLAIQDGGFVKQFYEIPTT